MKSISYKLPIIFSSLMFFSLSAFGQIWSEDFNTYPDGTTISPGMWNSYATDCDDSGPNTGLGSSAFGVWSGQFTINDVEGAPCCPSFGGGGNDNAWTTDPIDISAYCDVSISLDVTQDGTMECDSPGFPIYGCMGMTPPDNSQDQLVAEYQIDAGGWIQFGYACGATGIGTMSAVGLSGNTLEIRVSAATKANAEFYYFDNVEVNGTNAGTPTFTQLGPFCETDPAVGLPNVSNEGFTGTWDIGPFFTPSGNVGTTTITFTPAAGQCAAPTTMDIIVNPETAPTPPNLGPFCETDPPVALPTNLGGVTGNWSGAGVSSNTFDPSANTGTIFITFTPDPGQCATTTQASIVVNMAGAPVIPIQDFCETDPPFDLTTIQDPAFPTGTWSGTGVVGSTFIPTGQSGPILITFTPNTPCSQPGSALFNVMMETTPILQPGSTCQNSGPFDLTILQDPSFPTGTWSGPGVSGTTFDPTGQNGSVIVTFTSDQDCTAPATTTVTVDLPGTPTLSSANICQSQGIYDLTLLQDPAFPIGIWTGTGVTSSPLFDPTGLVGNITLTFTPVGGCAFAATTTITVDLPTSPNLGAATVCETDPPFDLTTIQDPFVPGGAWSGPGVTGTLFIPTGLSGPINLTFTPIGNCVIPGSTTITVEEEGMPALGSATICQTSGILNLTTLNDPAYPAGTWSGPGVTGNNFDPSGQSGPVVLTFSPTADCAADGTTIVTVDLPTAPTLGTASICESGNTFDLTTLQDPAYPTGTWSGPGVTGTTFDPSGQSGTVNVTFTPDADCSLPEQTTITLNEAPTFSNLTDDCDPVTQSYTITFDISGGTPPYTIDGVAIPGTTYTSGTIPSGTPYSFDLDDANDCGPVTISGTVDCSCATDAGTMDFNGSPLQVCHDGDIPINFNNDENLDGDDLLVFVLHDLPGTTLGTILATATPPATIITNPGLNIGQTYYVSAVAGSDDGTGNIDLNDPCLSVAQGVPVEIYEPQMTISGPTEICADDCAELFIEFSNGQNLYSIEFSIFINGVLEVAAGAVDIPTSTTIEICPGDFGMTSGEVLFEITGFSDGLGCGATSFPTYTFDVLPAANTNLSPTLCPGESVVVNGTQYDEANPTGQEIITNGAFNGCDSIIDVALSFFPSDTNFIIQTLCLGSSIEVNGTTYDASNPSGTEILTAANVNGCDSIISVDLTFNSEVTFNLEPTLCSTDSVVVNGTVFNAGNPNGSETFPGGSYLGCDSTVIVALDFYPIASSNLAPELCEGGSITINGTVYDEDNPTGQEILAGASANGCDSTLNIALVFNSEIFENLNPTLCPGESVTVNGTVYDEDNPTGQETFPLGSFLGCDSTVIIGLNFFPDDTTTLAPTLCPGGTLTVNGTVYDELNPSGFELLPGANVNGCDSVIFVDLTFSTSVSFDLDSTLCTGESIIVNGNIYDEITPTGSETFLMGSFLGCDSTVNIDLTFIQVDTNFIAESLCTGASLTINGTVYDETNPSGIEILPGANVNGCDSVISINLTFDSTVFGNLDSTLCGGGSVMVNGTVYDETNPSGMETFPGGSYLGCDSTVIINLMFTPNPVGNFNPTLCTGTSVTINGIVYSEANPTGTEILVGASYLGCDSTLNINLNFTDEVFEDLDPELCAGESITVNGTVYDEDNPFGEETFQNGSFFGCDSTVIIDLSFTDPIETDFVETFCSGGSVTINGTVYDESNPSGTETFQNAAQNGCDSTVNISLTFDSAVTFDLDSILCPGGQIFVNGTLYFSGNPSGTETFVGGSFLGCDSIVNVNLSFLPEATLTIDTMLNFGETLIVNGTTYSSSNATGVEMIPGGSWTGCDSTIFVNITFEGSFGVLTTAFSPTCPMGDDGAIRLDSIVGGELPYLVSLNGGPEATVFIFPQLYENLSAGFYSLTIRDALGVIATENIIVEDPPEPLFDLGPDQSIDLGQSITLTPDTDFTPIALQWEPPTYLECTDCLDPVSEPADDITYTLTATTPEGCVVSDDISIFVSKERQVYAPDAFSPNNDAINDEFTLFAGPQVAQINRLLIFDRWGGNVFEQYNFQPNNLAIGWDGTHNGEELDPAVFVWFAEVEFIDGEVVMFEGGVTLIR